MLLVRLLAGHFATSCRDLSTSLFGAQACMRLLQTVPHEMLDSIKSKGVLTAC